MNVDLLIFFALPIATIIVSIALQKILKCPPLVSATIFAIFLIVTFVINNLNFLIATIVYTIISFITAVLNELLSINSNCGNLEDGNLLTISSCGCNQDSDTALNNGLSARINVIPNSNNNGRTGNVCGCYRRR